ncbi:MAG: methyltransferase domain-containing protein [Acidobacteria bacterium]|nr:methyltransferase domain-containing protein [Acidobacteriota bacterium]
MTAPEIRSRIASLAPWFYEFDLGAHGRTQSALPPDVRQIFATRLEMVSRAVDAAFGPRLREIRCLDAGCHEGFYSVALARKGAAYVRGVDVRESSLQKARFVAAALGLANLEFEQQNCERLEGREGEFSLTLLLGILYHLENPMLCLRNVARLTGELCIVETQVIDEVEGETEWGSVEWRRPYQGALALIDESGEFYNQNPETGASPLALCPSPKALETMLHHAGFRRLEVIEPPPGAYEQHRRRKRLVYAAWK